MTEKKFKSLEKKRDRFFSKKNNFETEQERIARKSKKKWYKRKWLMTILILLFLILSTGGFFAFKTGYILNKISEGNKSGIGSIFSVLPVVGKKQDIQQDEKGRTNVLILGMRGENMPGGGLLADTIMVMSLSPQENKVGMISIPRDLYVEIPETNQKTKINSIYYYGEEQKDTSGLQMMKKSVSNVLGLDVHYSVALNFAGFKQLVDAIGGVEIELETPFYEMNQFVKGNECGGQFTLPEGKNVLNGEQALCYVRARENTSDFDRAKRQQLVIKKLKEKLVSAGTLTSFSKINGILDAVGDNVRTDMSSYEMKKFYEKYSSLKDATTKQRVLENSEEGLLKVPSDAAPELGYILIPRAGWGNYSEIHNLAENIFSAPEQSDIEPQKQYYKPQPASQDDKKKDDDDKDKDDDEEDEE